MIFQKVIDVKLIWVDGCALLLEESLKTSNKRMKSRNLLENVLEINKTSMTVMLFLSLGFSSEVCVMSSILISRRR